MDTGTLKTFAQSARRQLLEQVGARLEAVLRTDTGELREREKAIAELRQQISQSSKEEVIDRVAYTWFNRFCALRFMDANHYTRVGVVSPVAGFTQPEILQEAKQGVIDDFFKVNRGWVLDLLSGQLPAKNPQQEAYRLLLVGACNAYYEVMPFLFEPISDYTELLMPDDLLSESSVLQGMREALTEEACQDVEAIGWLYQFYISERKDEVFENLKKNIKIEARDIPAATQLFTPHWIVRYLVENSLGRLWLLNHPQSRLTEGMDYYIKPEQDETDYLKVSSPEEIKVCDPTCGSGHMLTYAFDLLYAIYAEQGYDPVQIPRLILEKNLYGIEIDERAGALAAFALTMKALQRDRRFFSRKVVPNICVLKNVEFTDSELDTYMHEVGRDLFTEPLHMTLRQFEQAENFGSLIQPQIEDLGYFREFLQIKGVSGNLFLHSTNQKVLQVLEMAEYLSPRYHVVVTNPPYMGKGMNSLLREFAEYHFPNSKADLFAMFIERIINMTCDGGLLGLMTPFTWMFLISYEHIRKRIIDEVTLASLIKPEYHSFFESAYVPICAFVVIRSPTASFTSSFIDISEFYGADIQESKVLEAIHNTDCGWFYKASPKDFKKIPGSPIAFWVDKKFVDLIEHSSKLGTLCPVKEGLNTGNNELFLRLWYEVSKSSIGFGNKSRYEAKASRLKWFPCNKGGISRKWYGNNDYIINWFNDGEELFNYPNSAMRNVDYYFKEGITWSGVSISGFTCRYFPHGHVFNSAGRSLLPQKNQIKLFLGLLNSKVAQYYFKIVAPTLSFTVGNVASMPVYSPPEKVKASVERLVERAIEIARIDWDSRETSWDFEEQLIIRFFTRNQLLVDTYNKVLLLWRDLSLELRQIETENSLLFTDIYGLRNQLSHQINLNEITLTCNPSYRYGNDKSSKELELYLLADTMKEFISYAVGCMFGRYSLDKPGLVLANQGETAEDYRRQVPEPTFSPDEDNVIPILEEGWFADDIAERFKKFLRVTFGDEHYDENLAFLENAIGKDVRSYFLKDFYNEHVRMYQKRPIYWLFSSPKGSFNALIYMHRYRPDTVSVVLNGYLREYRRKLSAHKAHLEQVSIQFGASQSEKTKALKEINELNKVLAELKEYEDDVLYPLATRKIEIDLDDGVKVNYPKFGTALKKIPGL